MKKFIRVGNVSIPLDDYVISGTALLGIRDSGKTYAAKGIAEQLLDADVPIIVFDPVGRWRFMKMAGDDSKRPKGYKIVVAGGEQPDLPLTPESAPEIVRAALRERIPLVIDLFDRKLSKADWRRIVKICIRIIHYENKGLLHVFLEESPEFIPQKVIDGETYAEVEKLARMGGNQSIGLTLIGQRAQEINKAVLDLCSTLILMKQRGAHAIDAVEKWMDKLSPETAVAVAKSLPHMGAGDAWVFTTEQEEPRRTKTAPLRSFHPNRRKPQLSARAAAARTTDTVDFVSRLSGTLETVIAEAAVNDPAQLRRRIAELEKQLKGAPAATDTKAIGEKAYAEGRAATLRQVEGLLKSLHVSLDGVMHKTFDAFGHGVRDMCLTINKAVGSTFDGSFDSLKKFAAQGAPSRPGPTPFPSVPLASPKKQTIPHSNGKTTIERGSVSVPGDGSLSKGEATILQALLTLPGQTTREAIGVLTGYKRSSRNEYLRQLTARGLITENGEAITVTDQGRAAMPNVKPLPTGRELQQFWLEKLSGGERKLLELLIEAYPSAIPRDGFDAAGYKRSSRNEYLRLLMTRQLISDTGSGFRASDILFS